MAIWFLKEAGFSLAAQPGVPIIPGSSGAVYLGKATLHFVCSKIATGRPSQTMLTWVGGIARCTHGDSARVLC
eukprot:5383955-Pyramimonas_sp.AAC.1